MRGSTFYRTLNDKEPTITSWLSALNDARGRTHIALEGINPWDAVVQHMRGQHHLLIGEPTAEWMQIQSAGDDSEEPRMIAVQGRDLITGLPTMLEVTSTEIQAIDNSDAAQPYIDWSAEPDGQTVGVLLYTIAAHEVNWLFVGVLEQPPPDLDKIEALFERDPEKLPAFVRGQTITQHYKRLRIVRANLVNAYHEMTLEDFQRTRMVSEMICSAEWVAHELCQFEAERRSEISSLLAAAREALDTKAVD